MAIYDIKEVIKDNKSFLMKNDLDGFYNNIVDGIIDGKYELEAKEMGEITAFLMNNNINVIHYLNKVIPCGCFDSLKVPDDLLVYDILKLPSKFYEIEESAFKEAKGFTKVDLRGIKRIGHWAFYDTPITEVWLDNDYDFMGISVFNKCPIKVIYLPKDNWHKHADELQTKLFSYGNVPKFEIYE